MRSSISFSSFYSNALPCVATQGIKCSRHFLPFPRPVRQAPSIIHQVYSFFDADPLQRQVGKRERVLVMSQKTTPFCWFLRKEMELCNMLEYYAWPSHFLFFHPCVSLISAFPFHISGNPMLK